MNLDFSLLEVKKPKRQISELTDIPKFDNLAGSILISVVICLVIGSINIKLLIFAPLIFYLVYNFIKSSGDSSIRISNFAVANGFRYKYSNKKGKGIARVNLGGVIGSENSKIPVSNQIIGKYKDLDFRLFSPFSKGNFMIMKVQLKNHYPHIVLDSTLKDPFFSNIGKFFSEDSRIHLEGDFDNYFRTYAKADPVDTLRILSPDMMSLMIDSGFKFDIEIFEDNLHIISSYKFSSKEYIESFFNVADILLDKLDRRKATVQANFDSYSRVK